MKNIIYKICFVMFIFVLFIPSVFSQTIPTTRKVIDISQDSPTGTYTSSSFSLEGYSRIKGMIILNGGTATTPAAHINQIIATSTAFWFGTNTVSFHHDGTYWKGETNVPISGKYGRLIIGSFGNTTNWQGYLYAVNESGDKFVEAQRNETVNNVRLTYFIDKYSNVHGVVADHFNSYNLGTASGYIYDDTGGNGTQSGSVAIRGFDMNDISISINSIVDGTVTVRIQNQVGLTNFWSTIVDLDFGTVTTHALSITEHSSNIRIGLNKTGNGTASVSVVESYSTKIN